MVTAVGINAAQTFASVRARISRAEERDDIYRCLPEEPSLEDRDPVVVAPVGYLCGDDAREGPPAEWFAELAGRALRELSETSGPYADLATDSSLYVALPTPRRGWAAKDAMRFMTSLNSRMPGRPYERARVAWGGRAVGIALIAEACAAISARRTSAAVVVGVDSYLRTRWLAELDEAYLLKSARNFDGFLPGEAAGCLLLESVERASKRRERPLADIRATAHGVCPDPREDNTGEVLAKVIGACLPAGPAAPVLVTSDLNGCTPRAREWGFALGRLGARMPDPSMEFPVTSLGDIGAATGIVLPAITARYLASKHRQHRHALVWAASEGDDGARSALMLARPDAVATT